MLFIKFIYLRLTPGWAAYRKKAKNPAAFWVDWQDFKHRSKK